MPTPLRDGLPDLHYVEDAARLLGPHVNRGACVVLESTTYPGTTEEISTRSSRPARADAGEDFRLGLARADRSGQPARGTSEDDRRSYPVDEASVAASAASTAAGRPDGAGPGTREAELAKLLENTFRHVNIALVNELAVYCPSSASTSGR